MAGPVARWEGRLTHPHAWVAQELSLWAAASSPHTELGEIRAWGAGGRACNSHPSPAHGHLGARRGVAGAKAGHPWAPMCSLRRGFGGHPPTAALWTRKCHVLSLP